jgi:hypothetical protein
MDADNFELIYWSDNGGISIPLEQWQTKIIVDILGLALSADGSIICYTHDTVKRKIGGILHE